MVYVVERYLPGLSRADLLPRLSRLEPVTNELRGEGSAVRYLGSTIVLEDDACFCQFDASSVAVVTEANRRADVPFDRIVPALLVQPTHRSSAMSISTTTPRTAGRRRSRLLASITTIAVLVALTASAVATYAVASAGSARWNAPTQASVLRHLTPSERRYVLGIAALTSLQLWAAFGTSPTPPAATTASSPTASSATTTPSVASPILPACGPGHCWHGAGVAATGRSNHNYGATRRLRLGKERDR